MRKMKWVLLLCALSLSFVFTACNKRDEDTDSDVSTKIVLTTGFMDNEVFRIGKASCYLPEVNVYLTNIKNQYESVYGDEIWSQVLVKDVLEERVKDTVIARIAQIKTMNLLASDYGVTLTSQEEGQAESAAKAYMDTLNETEESCMGVNKDLIYSMYCEYALANKLYNSIIEDVNPEISDDEARTITVKTIFIKTYSIDGNGNITSITQSSKEKAYEKAQQIHSYAQNGEDFDGLIHKYSEEEKSTYSFGKGEMEAIFEDTAFNLSTDEISDVIETQYGYYIIKCVSTFDRKETDANKEKIVEKRKEEVFNQVYNEYVLTLTRNLNQKVWDQVTFIENKDVNTENFFQIYEQYFKQTS